MNRYKKKGLSIYLTGVALTLLGIAGMIFFLNQVKNYPGQSMPGKELFGAFVLSPALLFGGIIMAIKARQKYSFVSGTAPHEKVKKRLITVLILAVLAAAALIILLRNALSVVLAAMLITICVCALIRLKNTTAYLNACYLAALAATVIVVIPLSTLPSAPGGTLLVVNGFRSYMSNRSGNLIGIILILAAGPLLLAWPLAILSRGLFEVCTWEL